MNRLLCKIGAVAGCLLLASVGYCQDKVSFMVSGREHGKLAAAVQDGTVYVDVQKTARKLGTSVELFARSKQAKVTTRGFYAILTAASKEVLVNANPVLLASPVMEQGGVIMAPVSFFQLPQFQQAVNKEISFTGNTLSVERRYDLARLDNVLSAHEDQLVFQTRRAVTWQIQELGAHAIQLVFPGAVIKRDEYFRLKTEFIKSVSISQGRTDAVVKVSLAKKGKFWDVAERDGKIILRIGAEALKPLPADTSAVASQTPVVPLQKPASTQAPAPKTDATLASDPVQPPSVLGGEDDGVEEMPDALADESSPAIKAASSAQISAVPPAKPQPVIKSAPAAVISSARKKMRIVVDPGHGGKDPGAVRSRVREKDLNLAVSKELFKLLKKGGFEVKITRDNDTFIALSERSRMANNFKADLFVSIHTNASKNKQANGFQVYFRSEKASDKEAAETAALENEAMQYEEVHYNFVDALLQSLAKNEYINESSKLAGYVRNAVYKQPGIGIGVSQNDSVRQANFYVLKGVQSPAILVEMGFISSQKDRGRLTQSAVQKKMAQGIYNGIYNYAKKEGWLN